MTATTWFDAPPTKDEIVTRIKAITDVELLTAVRELLADPNRWTKSRMRTTVLVDGRITDAYCLIGAAREATLGRVYPYAAQAVVDIRMANLLADCVPDHYRRNPPETYSRYEVAGVKLAEAWADVITFNDNSMTTHSDIISALDCAIAKAKENTK